MENPAVIMENKRRSSTVRLHGLRNQGSTCYLNSVLQVLFWTRSYREAVIRHPKNSDFIDVQLANLFQELKKNIGTTEDVTKKLGIKRVNQQQDSAEHFEKILALSSPEASQVFRGKLVHTTKCHGCKTETGVEGHCWHLPLPLVNSHSKDFSVIEGMEEFFRSSEFSGENQVYCENCDSKQDATVASEMEIFPAVLTLLLKRFEFSYQFMCFTKNECPVDIPYLLNIPELQGERYELFAFINHSGSLKSGHYVATIKCEDNNQRWVTFNDSYVDKGIYNQFQGENDNSMLKSQSAYLLFYRREKHVKQDYKRHKGGEDTTEDEEQPKKKKMDNEMEVKKREEHVPRDDGKREPASKKAQVEERKQEEAPREEKEQKDVKTKEVMVRRQEDKGKEWQEMKEIRRQESLPVQPDRNRSSNTREPEPKRQETRKESFPVQPQPDRNRSSYTREPEPAPKRQETRKESLPVQPDRNRSSYTREPEPAPKRQETRKESLPVQPDRNRSSYTREAEPKRQETRKESLPVQPDRNRSSNTREPEPKRQETRKESFPVQPQPDRNRSSNTREAEPEPEPKRQESRNQDKNQPKNRKSGPDRLTENKTEKTERKMEQDQIEELQPLQEDRGNPSDSTVAKTKREGKWWRIFKKNKKDKKDKKDKKNELVKSKNNQIQCLSCFSSANRGSDD